MVYEIVLVCKILGFWSGCVQALVFGTVTPWYFVTVRILLNISTTVRVYLYISLNTSLFLWLWWFFSVPYIGYHKFKLSPIRNIFTIICTYIRHQSTQKNFISLDITNKQLNCKLSFTTITYHVNRKKKRDRLISIIILIDFYRRQPWLKDNNQSGHNCNEKFPLFLSDFNQIWILKTELSKPPPHQYKILLESVQWHTSWYIQADRRTDMSKLKGNFCDFTNASRSVPKHPKCI